jgi:hypothetical protein
MYSTTAYLYQQKQKVLLIDTSGVGETFLRRWQPVYSKKLKIHRGVDNVILFEFVNQDQKPVNITGSTVTFRLISTNGNILLLSKDLEILSATTGRAKVTLLSTELDNLDAQPVGWSLERNTVTGTLYEPVFTDDYSGGRGTADIVDSVYPAFVPSEIMTVPTHKEQGIDNPNRLHTSTAYVTGRELVTFQFEFDNFSGNVKAQGSKTQLGPWYDIGSQQQYINRELRDYWNIEGYHNYLRFEINQYGEKANPGNIQVGGGAVTSIGQNSQGSEWLSTPLPNVEFDGLGTGAEAFAVASGGAITSIVLTQGGQGYVKAPNAKINNGSITSIAYR